jgi:nicotinamide mononucleotide (NMN) deamidase PncC
MTDEEKKQLVDAVITELQKNKKDISTATIIDALQGDEMVVCYDNEGKISRISPQTITKTEYVSAEAYKNLEKTGQIKEDVEYNIYEE